jgi:hypothetical protein
MSSFISTDNETAKRELGLYYYSSQKEILHELAGEAEARLRRYTELRGISVDDEKDIAVGLHRTLFDMVTETLTAEYNDQPKIDEAGAFIRRILTLLDSAEAAR